MAYTGNRPTSDLPVFNIALEGPAGPPGPPGASTVGPQGPQGIPGPPGPAGTGDGASVSISDTPPTSPTDGALWWESDSGKMYIYYNDGTSTQWVLSNPVGSGSGGGGGSSGSSAIVRIGDLPPTSSLADGMLWWESDSGKLYIRYNDGSSTQWVLANPIGETGALVTVMHGQENRLRVIEGLPPLSLEQFRTENGI